MHLLDHFRPPLRTERHWEGFHGRWAAAISDVLNEILPAGYFAEFQVHVGSQIEVDVGTFEKTTGTMQPHPADGNGGVATLPVQTWAPPAPTFEAPAVFPDSIEVLVCNTQAGPTLVGALELVSPGNKDRLENRRAFAAKCATYLQQGVGLIVVDVVTNFRANLHNEFVALMQLGEHYLVPAGELYATAYRPVRRVNDHHIDIWHSPLALGQPLPLLPLSLDKEIVLPLDLEPPYNDACRRTRLT